MSAFGRIFRGAPGSSASARQPFGEDFPIECSKTLTGAHPVSTRFRMDVKLTDREKGGEFLYSYRGWTVDVPGVPKD